MTTNNTHFVIQCPHCAQQMKAEAAKLPLYLQKEIKCVKCSAMMAVPAAWLVEYGNNNAPVFILKKGKYVIGRKSANKSADIEIENSDSFISRKHCEVEITEKGMILLRDLGSTNGTFLQKRRLHPQHDCFYLQHNQVFKIGQTVLVLRSVLHCATSKQALDIKEIHIDF